MTKILLSVHMLAAIVTIGPVTVAASMFPAVARRGDAAALRTLHRICRVYATLGIVVPVFGLATASSLGVLGDAGLVTSIALTALAAVVLIVAVLPRQAAALPDGPVDRALPMWTDRAVDPDGRPGAGRRRAARPAPVDRVRPRLIMNGWEPINIIRAC